MGQGTQPGSRGRAEGSPVRHVAARQIIEGRVVVTVVPVTHSPPIDPAEAVEIPPALKAHFGLDDLPSWIVVTETNDFPWPGPDLRPCAGKPDRFHYTDAAAALLQSRQGPAAAGASAAPINRVPRS